LADITSTNNIILKVKFDSGRNLGMALDPSRYLISKVSGLGMTDKRILTVLSQKTLKLIVQYLPHPF
jgi:hypothetical protein